MIKKIVDASGEFTVHIINQEIDELISSDTALPKPVGVIGDLSDVSDFINFGENLRDNRADDDLDIIHNSNSVCILSSSEVSYNIHIIHSKKLVQGRVVFLLIPMKA